MLSCGFFRYYSDLNYGVSLDGFIEVFFVEVKIRVENVEVFLENVIGLYVI